MKTIIVDDEEKSRITLKNLLEKYCKGVEVCALCDSVDSALSAIEEHQPALVFLDIEMPFQNGFELLKKFETPKFQVIFVTAYDHFAIKAIKFSAVDYLLKPVDIDELQEAIQRVRQSPSDDNSHLKKFELLLSNIKNRSARIAVPTSDGLQMLNATDIIKCTADECYTNIWLKGGKKLIVSKLLKDYEKLLEDYNFFRIHNSYLVNLTHVVKYVKGEGGYVVMSEGEPCEVSRRKKNELISRLGLLQI